MAKSYKLIKEEKPEIILGLVSLINDALRFEARSQRDKNVPNGKRWLDSFPAVKIGRLAINREYSRMGLGSFCIDMIKQFFLTNNRTGCRFVTVDAYNKPGVIAFYSENKFITISKSPEEKSDGEVDETISMFYNLQSVRI